jgi:hypothetical protein
MCSGQSLPHPGWSPGELCAGPESGPLLVTVPQRFAADTADSDSESGVHAGPTGRVDRWPASRQVNEKGRVHKKKHLTTLQLPRIILFFFIYEFGLQTQHGKCGRATLLDKLAKLKNRCLCINLMAQSIVSVRNTNRNNIARKYLIRIPLRVISHPFSLFFPWSDQLSKTNNCAIFLYLFTAKEKVWKDTFWMVLRNINRLRRFTPIS